MPNIRLKEGESPEGALRRFKRACEKAGILSDVRRREHYEKPTAVRKRKAAAAVKRHLKKLSKEAPLPRVLREKNAKMKKGRGRRD